ncbi:MAG: 30S ribosomal protein S20 [Cryobacterium sp.]|nr:30S ribosomal protein S20 [Oligoflexia bacterium]
MANTKQSSKRARQTIKRAKRNTTNKSITKTVVRMAVEAISTLDAKAAEPAYNAAVKALAKAASKGAIPKGRAARKISRLTRLARKPKVEAAAVKAPGAKAAAKAGAAKAAAATKAAKAAAKTTSA